MTDYTQTSTGQEDAPPPDPADQPQPPGEKACPELPTGEVPTLEDPEKCPEPPCVCPKGPGSDSNCLEDLINDQTVDITAAEKAKAFKTDLEALLAKAKVVKQEYNAEKYDKLLKQWKEQDAEIVELLRKLDCAVPCWRCVIECHICPLLNEMRYAEQRLYGDDAVQMIGVRNLNDLLYWHTRNKDVLERRFNRIKSVLAAWEKPAQTIEKVLADNAKLTSDANKALGSDAGKAVYDVFLRLVPMHLAIAPPKSTRVTRIRRIFTDFCNCDSGTQDNCCGPDVGLWSWSLRQRLIGPQPYLIDPNRYMDVICCLVKDRYGPAKAALAKADADLVTTENKIKRARAQIDDGLKSFDKDARGAITSVIDCKKYEQGGPPPTSSQAR
jgi:hypothetical protein